MMTDPIVDQVRAIRDEIAKEWQAAEKIIRAFLFERGSTR